MFGGQTEEHSPGTWYAKNPNHLSLPTTSAGHSIKARDQRSEYPDLAHGFLSMHAIGV
ncbi:hypothetical protein MGWOODY_Clf1371 [hydrothermal vent metagenome]|uniref:Uncharacterized protein n=1 Tax=hydrothermal vent metagenome TaxID=652676 RepID=A0A160VAB5_9ZZZZ